MDAEAKKGVSSLTHENLLKPLGAVTANFTYLDGAIQFAIWVFLFGHDARPQLLGQAVTSELSFRQLVSLFGASCRLRFPDRDHGQLEAICRRVRELEQKRNQILHSFWVGGSDGKARRFKSTAKGELKLQSEEVDVATLTSLAADLEQAVEEVHQFRKALFA